MRGAGTWLAAAAVSLGGVWGDGDGARRLAEELGPGFGVVQTRRFAVVSDCGVGESRGRAQLMEATYVQFRRVMRRLGVEVEEPGDRLVAVVIRDRGRYEAYARGREPVATDWAGGFYSAATNRAVLYDDRTSESYESASARLEGYAAEAARRREEGERVGGAAGARLLESAAALEGWVSERRGELESQAARSNRAKVVHETVHLLSFNCGVQSPGRVWPVWLTEGLATSFETDDAVGAFGPEFETPWRRARFEEVVRSGRLVPVRRLAGMVEVGEDVEAVYACSYALFVHLFRYERERLGAYIRAVGELEPTRATEGELVRLFEAHFGDVERVERRLVRGVSRAGG